MRQTDQTEEEKKKDTDDLSTDSESVAPVLSQSPSVSSFVNLSLLSIANRHSLGNSITLSLATRQPAESSNHSIGL